MPPFAIAFFLSLLFFRPSEFYPLAETAPQEIPPEIQHYLAQPYTYFAEGAQIYAFASQDGRYVLKVFKAKHHKKWNLARFLRNIRRTRLAQQQSREKWKHKFHDTSRRYEMAHRDLAEETGLLFLHFGKTTLPTKIQLIKKFPRRIDLSKYPFILQRRAILAPHYLKSLPPDRFEEAVASLKALFVSRTHKGYSDPRQSLSVNYGFIDGKAIQIDVGKIEPFAGNREAEIQKIHRKVDSWLKEILNN